MSAIKSCPASLVGVLVLVVFTWGTVSTARGAETERVSLAWNGAEANGGCQVPRISADGRWVVFESDASNLVSSDTNGVTDIFIHDRLLGTIERANVSSSGQEANSWSSSAAVTPGGRWVVFESNADNLAPGDTNVNYDIFLRDRQTGTTTLISTDSSGTQGNSWSRWPAVTPDGRYVVFASDATNLVPGDTNGRPDIFRKDLQTGAVVRVNLSSGGSEANSDSTSAPSISDDGNLVTFWSMADNLVAGDTNAAWDIFVRDVSAGTTVRASVSSSGAEGNASSEAARICGNGSAVVFTSYATNLVGGDTNGWQDVFVHELATGATTRVSVDSLGGQADSYSTWASISADGMQVAFQSWATNLLLSGGDTNGVSDIYLHHRSSGFTERVSVGTGGIQADRASYHDDISADGSVVVFGSDATNLVSGDTNGRRDIFMRDTCPTTASWSNYGTGWPGTLGVPAFTAGGPPERCAPITLTLGNSQGSATAGVLFLGLAPASISGGWGGTLLVTPSMILPLFIPGSGLALPGTIPCADGLCGLSLFLQVLEADSGASAGVSATAGLELDIGT